MKQLQPNCHWSVMAELVAALVCSSSVENCIVWAPPPTSPIRASTCVNNIYHNWSLKVALWHHWLAAYGLWVITCVQHTTQLAVAHSPQHCLGKGMPLACFLISQVYFVWLKGSNWPLDAPQQLVTSGRPGASNSHLVHKHLFSLLGLVFTMASCANV
jgi:hypothetical protein